MRFRSGLIAIACLSFALARIVAAANRAFGYGRFGLMTMGTGKSLEELARLLSAYRAESPR